MSTIISLQSSHYCQQTSTGHSPGTLSVIPLPPYFKFASMVTRARLCQEVRRLDRFTEVRAPTPGFRSHVTGCLTFNHIERLTAKNANERSHVSIPCCHFVFGLFSAPDGSSCHPCNGMRCVVILI